MNTQQLKTAFAMLPKCRADSSIWLDKCQELRDHVRDFEPDGFLNWAGIQATMFVGEAPQYVQEVEYVRARAPEFESKVGAELCGLPQNGLIHQAARLLRWEEHTGERLAQLKTIHEIGGGYGAMVRAAQALGFAGAYTLWDLAEWSILQQYYLERCGIAAEYRKGFPEEVQHCDLLIACCSLSETSNESQQRYIEQIEFEHLLIEGKDALWLGKDNRKMFRLLEQVVAKVWAPYPTENYYLFL